MHMGLVPGVWVNCVTDCSMFRQMAAVRQMELRLLNWKIRILFETGCCGWLLSILFIWNVRWLKIYEKFCNERVAEQLSSNISSFMRCYYRISIYTHHPYRISSHEMLKYCLFFTSLYKFANNKSCHFSVPEFSFTFFSQRYFEMIRGKNYESVSAYVHDTHYHDKFG